MATAFVCESHGDTPADAFRNAVESATEEGAMTPGIADKTAPGWVLIDTDQRGAALPEVLDADDALEVAQILLAADDPRIADKNGPAGVLRYGDDAPEPAWLFFGWAPA